MTTHILFENELQTSKLTYSIEPITKDWHLTCNNFKGTEQECIAEGDKKKAKATERYERKYCAPHYANASYGSIYDY
jgi:hypothetical protein